MAILELHVTDESDRNVWHFDLDPGPMTDLMRGIIDDIMYYVTTPHGQLKFNFKIRSASEEKPANQPTLDEATANETSDERSSKVQAGEGTEEDEGYDDGGDYGNDEYDQED